MAIKNIKIALVGNPNSGKTTMFNALTGSSQKVGNWPGVTVEKKEGRLKGHKNVQVIDLPGVYSLSPYTPEEKIARDYIIDEKPDVIIDIVDSTNIERNLYLTTQLIDTGIPVVVALNMADLIDKQGINIDVAAMSEKLGCRVVKTSASRRKGTANLTDVAISVAAAESKREASQSLIDEAYGNLDGEAEEDAINNRYDFVESVVAKSVARSTKANALTTSDKIDRILTNKWLALPIFFLIMWVVYYISISTVGDWTIGWVETLFEWISGGAESLLVSMGAGEIVMSLVIDGIIGSIGAIFVFVPQIMILFFFLSLLEDSGYMARVAFIMDRIFRKFGLSGKSFIPMLIGTGCSVPGIMASRTIENENDRNMTIVLTPFLPCGAKLPVFAMFIAIMFRQQTWVGPSIYIIAIVMVILCGLVLKHTKIFKGDPSPFVMEMPDYKVPALKGVAIHMWEKGKSFIKKAGTIIFIACVIIWFLQSFGTTGYVGENIDQSFLAAIGGAIKFLFIPLGFGDSWAPAVAAVTGLVAKEVVVATFASVGSVTAIYFTQVTAFAFMMFTIFAAPCAAAIGAMHREFGHWKKTLAAVAFQTGLAYIMAMLVNLIGSAVLSGTAAVNRIDISSFSGDLETMAEETAVTNFDIVGIVFLFLIVVALIIMAFAQATNKKDYTDIDTSKAS